jgi:hypothetical protein
MFFLVSVIDGCSKKIVQPIRYENQNFYFGKKVIVQTQGDYFVNDTKREDTDEN